MEPLLTLTELAELLKVNPRTVRRWIPLGLPALNIGGKQRPDWRFVWAEVKAWLEDRQREDVVDLSDD